MKFKVALIQMSVTSDKTENLSRVKNLVTEAAQSGADVIILPECFNSPYDTSCFPVYAESIPGESTNLLSALAKENQVFIIGGSIPERDGSHIYNTCPVVDPSGNIVAKHRKLYLVDIHVPGKLKFREADSLTAGNKLTTLTTQFCKIGIGVCYDIRFPELSSFYREEGCKFLVFPGAFNMITGPSHMEPLVRGRAIDNQLYVAFASSARNEISSYRAWGHSIVADPWGDVIATCDQSESIVYCDINPEYVREVRGNLPLTSQRRTELYSKVT